MPALEIRGLARYSTSITPGSAVALDGWVEKEARPISLRQLTFFGRALSRKKLLESANYVRTELPTRLAHRLRDMQTLPYVVVTNQNISHVYELYHKAFDILRRVKSIESLEDNESYCKIIQSTLEEHLTVIPRTMIGILECRHLMRPETIDVFMNTLLKSRISRRVIAEQHIALTEAFNAPRYFEHAQADIDSGDDLIGEVMTRCNAQEVVRACYDSTIAIMKEIYGSTIAFPDLKMEGHLDATFPYTLNHLMYIIGELLRNSIQAVVEQPANGQSPGPISVLICEAPQYVTIRISDKGGGIPSDVLPDLWSFCKGQRSETHLENLARVPRMAATIQELRIPERRTGDASSKLGAHTKSRSDGSLSSLVCRPPNLRLGMGLPMSRVYAEYWAGSLELHSLDGYGVDAFLQISKLGNKNEQLSTRASMDAI